MITIKKVGHLAPKKNVSKKILTLIAILIGVFIYSQNKISVEIIDNETKEPLSNSLYQIKKNGNIIKFGTLYQAKEEIKISENLENLTLVISKLGYQKYENPIKSENIKINLIKDATEIKEVVIKNTNIFKVKEDTISFNLQNLTNGNEQKLGDVIKKIPGLSIGKDGKVKHNGENIGNILIEGQEFFGEKHQMATDNINAKGIKGIDYIPNYFADNGNMKTALNIKLKEDYKNIWTGDIDAGAGASNKYAVHSNLFKFQKNGNFAIITDFNNTGKKPISILDYIEMKEGNDISKLSEKSFQLPNFLSENIKIAENNNQFLGLQFNKKFNKKLGFKLYSMANFNQNKEKMKSEKTYFTNTGNLFTEESDNAENQYFFLNTKAELNYNISPTEQLHYDLILNPSFENLNQHITRAFPSRNLQEMLQEKKKNDWAFGQNLRYKRSFSSKTDFSFEINQNFITKTQNLILNSSDFLFDTNEKMLLQKTHHQDSDWRFFLHLKTKYNSGHFNFSTEYHNKNQKLSIENHSTFYKNHFYNFLAEWQNRWTSKISTTLGLKWLTTELAHQKNHYNYQKLEPYLKFSYKANGGQLNISSAIQHKPYTIFDLFPHQFMENYNTLFFSNLELNNYAKNINLTANYFKFFSKSASHLSARYSFTKTLNPVSTMTEIGNNLLWHKNSKIITQNSVFHHFHSSYDVKFRKLPLGLKTNLNGSLIQNTNFLNQKANLYTSQNMTWSQNLMTYFYEFPIQLDLGYKLNFTNIHQSLYSKNSTLFNYEISLTLSGNLLSNLFWAMGGEYTNQKFGNTINSFYSFNPQIIYTPKNIPFEFSLIGNNIFNLKQRLFLDINQSNYFEQILTKEDLPGNLLFSVKYKF